MMMVVKNEMSVKRLAVINLRSGRDRLLLLLLLLLLEGHLLLLERHSLLLLL